MLSELFPPGVIADLASAWMWSAPLTPDEQKIVAGAVDKRRREFAAGRVCAREVLNRLGFGGNRTIGKDRHGAPLWPEEITGSISHSGEICVVALARRTRRLQSLGVDVEKDSGLDRDLLDLVCDDLEKTACRRAADPGRLAKLVFSAKESVYKCLYPITGTVMDFHDVHVELDVPGRRFAVRPRRSLPDEFAGAACGGRIVLDGGHVFTSCILSLPADSECRTHG